jgi:site-specific recombinase XerD
MEGYILSDIGKQLIPPHVEASRPRYLTKEEVGRLSKIVRPYKRDYAIIQLLLQTGIKLSELTGLTLNDFQIAEMRDNKGNEVNFIRIKGSLRNKDREVPLNPITTSVISDYLSVRGNAPSDYLFLNKSGDQLGKRGVEKLIDKYFKQAGIENASVNALRHTFGAYQASIGTKLNTIQKVMGHRDIKTTGRYYHL